MKNGEIIHADLNGVQGEEAFFFLFAWKGGVFERIDALAFETYAPATEESRAGAGAGLTDND